MADQHQPDVSSEPCNFEKFSVGIAKLWISTLFTAIAVCASFVFLVSRIMEWGGFHAP